MSIANKIFTSLMAGAAVGAVVGLLFAPKLGKVTRRFVGIRARQLTGEYVGSLKQRRQRRSGVGVVEESTNGHVSGAD